MKHLIYYIIYLTYSKEKGKKHTFHFVFLRFVLIRKVYDMKEANNKLASSWLSIDNLSISWI